MINDFEAWSAPRAERNPFSALDGAVLAIEATFYLERLLTSRPSKEPLLAALGGAPFALRTHIENELEILKSANISPVFVFKGLEVGKAYDPFAASNDAVRANVKAWELYDAHQPEPAVDTFGNSGYARPEDYYRLLQSILREYNIPFQVAPYCAWGQLAYLEQYTADEKKYVDAIAGSSEILLYNVDTLITNLNFELQEFTFVRRQTCVEELGNLTPEIFVDACLLSGTSLLQSLPQLANPPARRPHKIQAAADLMKGLGHTGIAVVTNYQDDSTIRRINYVDRYKRNRLAIKHQVILTADGKVEPLDLGNAPADMHELIGQRLPDELIYYMSRGAIAPRVLNYLTSGQIVVGVPVDGGESAVYRDLVRDQLTPLRSLTLSLLAQSLTYAYQYREVRLRCWFADDNERMMNLREQPSHKTTIDSWKVTQDLFEDQADRNALSFAVQSLSDTSFAAKTLPTSGSSKILKTKAELTANSVWRFLHLRGYIDDKHILTPWGKVLNTALSSLSAASDLEEAVFLAVDLLRLGLLNSQIMFPSYSGGPMHGSEIDKSNTLLLSRIACLVKLRHQSIGFTGPLSRHLLAYTSIISAVQSSLRDLLEISLATLLLNGDADRESVELADLGLDLPLLLPIDCSLGIAMKHYLDELANAHPSDPTSAEAREDVKKKGPKEWFPYALDFVGDLERVFGLWDALFAALKIATQEGLATGKTGEEWVEVDVWVQGRR